MIRARNALFLLCALLLLLSPLASAQNKFFPYYVEDAGNHWIAYVIDTESYHYWWIQFSKGSDPESDMKYIDERIEHDFHNVRRYPTLEAAAANRRVRSSSDLRRYYRLQGSSSITIPRGGTQDSITDLGGSFIGVAEGIFISFGIQPPLSTIISIALVVGVVFLFFLTLLKDFDIPQNLRMPVYLAFIAVLFVIGILPIWIIGIVMIVGLIFVFWRTIMGTGG